jgi:hypothetical protein
MAYRAKMVVQHQKTVLEIVIVLMIADDSDFSWTWDRLSP